VTLPFDLLPAGIDLYGQVWGLHVASNTYYASTGILYSGN
jgi:hypothetical protein